MTIHRSKGLEFKHVYITCAVDGSLPHDFSLESARKGNYEHLEEERRLLYVAMTRAKEHLLISTPTTAVDEKQYLRDFLSLYYNFKTKNTPQLKRCYLRLWCVFNF